LTYFAMLLVSWAPWIVLGGAGAYFARRYVRAIEGRSVASAEIAELRERVSQLEESIAGVSKDVERIGAGHEFMSELLSDKQSGR
jgi:hypothetical protein